MADIRESSDIAKMTFGFILLLTLISIVLVIFTTFFMRAESGREEVETNINQMSGIASDKFNQTTVKGQDVLNTIKTMKDSVVIVDNGTSITTYNKGYLVQNIEDTHVSAIADDSVSLGNIKELTTKSSNDYVASYSNYYSRLIFLGVDSTVVGYYFEIE